MMKQRVVQLMFAPLLLLTGAMQVQTKVLSVPIGQPPEERAAQMQLPRSQNPIWLKFARCKIGYNNHSGLFNIAVTPEIKAMAGKPITLNGFVLPLDGSDMTRHFLLTRNTPVCMFCPPGQPNEVVEVIAPQPIPWTDKMVTVTGPLTLINNGEKGMFFRIVASAVK